MAYLAVGIKEGESDDDVGADEKSDHGDDSHGCHKENVQGWNLSLGLSALLLLFNLV